MQNMQNLGLMYKVNLNETPGIHERVDGTSMARNGSNIGIVCFWRRMTLDGLDLIGN